MCESKQNAFRFACLREAGGTQPLLDTDFPDLTSRGRGLSLGVFKHKYFMQLYLWGPAAHKDKKDHKKCSHATRPCNEAPEKTLKVRLLQHRRTHHHHHHHQSVRGWLEHVLYYITCQATKRRILI